MDKDKRTHFERRFVISIFLGAGFSAPAGVPLASRLFERKPEVDGITRQRLVERVMEQWEWWHAKNSGSPEQYLAYLQDGMKRAWEDAQWYVGLVIALAMGRIELVGMRTKVTRHNLDRASGIPAYEEFWSTIFQRTEDVRVITTNYDILAERGIRHRCRPRVPRPGFHYGWGTEELAGGGYPSYSHIKKIAVSGSVPLYKLHGSVSWSWSWRNGKLERYYDCRPAIRGDAAIVAPIISKTLPPYLQEVWKGARNALFSSRLWLIVGYSLPEYDKLVRDLLKETVRRGVNVHIFDPDSRVAERFQSLLPNSIVQSHPGIPECLDDLRKILDKVASTAGLGVDRSRTL